MRAIALMLVCSCAPMAASAPSSIPWVRVDRSLSGSVCSREAAEAMAMRREGDRLNADRILIDCEARGDAARAESKENKRRADSNAWWGSYGGLLVLVGIIGGIATGFAGGFAAAK